MQRDLLDFEGLPSLEGHPENLTNEHIHRLGEFYFAKYGVKPISGFPSLFTAPHRNHPIAEDLKNYNENTQPMYKWLFLAKKCAGMENNNGRLSKEIRRCFYSAFDQNVKTEIVPPSAQKYAGFSLGLTKQTADLDTDTVYLLLKGIVYEYYFKQYEKPQLEENALKTASNCSK